MWNLSLLCGSAASAGGCALLCERRDPGMHERGMWLRSWESPRLVPVWLFSPAGPPIRAWLNAEGTYDLQAPAGAAV